jgi:hypothetical protein
MPVITRSQAKKNENILNELQSKKVQLNKIRTKKVSKKNDNVIEAYYKENMEYATEQIYVNVIVINIFKLLCHHSKQSVCNLLKMDSLNHMYKFNTQLHCLLLIINQYDANSCKKMVDSFEKYVYIDGEKNRININTYLIAAYNKFYSFISPTVSISPSIKDTIFLKRYLNYCKRIIKLLLKVIRKLDIKYERQIDGNLQLIE